MTASANHSPLEQFAVSPVLQLPKLFGIDASITNSALFMLLSVALVGLFFAYSMRKRAAIPGRMQSLAEMIYQFVDDMVKENVGHDGRKFFPIIFTLFLFILFVNLLGLVPYAFSPTSHIIVTLGLAAFIFTGITIIAFIKKGPIGFFEHFIPEGLPIAIVPLIFLIELISFLSRPFSLGIRLAANMVAGHTLIKVIAGFVVPLGIMGALPLAFIVMLNGLEVFVCILQAYVFTLLSSIYLSEALSDHH